MRNMRYNKGLDVSGYEELSYLFVMRYNKGLDVSGCRDANRDSKQARTSCFGGWTLGYVHLSFEDERLLLFHVCCCLDDERLLLCFMCFIT